MNPMYTQPMQPPYAQHIAALEQMRSPYPPAQPIQTLKAIQPQGQCYFVGSAEEMTRIPAQPNTIYIGINQTSQEIYLRQWTNDGNIELVTYTKSGGKQEQPEWKAIMSRLDSIETKLNGVKNEPNVTNVNATNDNGQVAGAPVNGNVPTNDVR